MAAIAGFLIMTIVTVVGMIANVGLILMAEEKRDLILPAIFSVLLVLLGSGTGVVGHKTMNNLESLMDVKNCERQETESPIPEKAEDLGSVDSI